MCRCVRQKLNSRGLVRAALLLLIPLAVLLALLLWPAWQKFRFQSQQIACTDALATARDSLSIDYIANNQAPAPDDARAVVGQVMDGWQDLCPDGGTVYLVKTQSGAPPYTLVCGLHDTDTKQRTRLNADNALTQLQNALAKAKTLGLPAPQTLTAAFNGKTYTARPVTEPVAIYRGTETTAGVKGTVLYYGLRGQGAFAAAPGAADGEICYFLFADENHCAVWQPAEGWTGDSAAPAA